MELDFTKYNQLQQQQGSPEPEPQEKSGGFQLDFTKYNERMGVEAPSSPTGAQRREWRTGNNEDRIEFENPYAEQYKEAEYSEDTLVQDEYFGPIQKYLTRRYGSQWADPEVDRREGVEVFLNNMRAFDVGHSTRSISEVAWLNSLESEEDIRTVAEAYALFENMPSLISGEVSFFEGAEIVQDYARSAILDPANLVTAFVGKVAARGGMKSATKVATKAAQDKIRNGGTVNQARRAFTQGLKEAREVIAKDVSTRRAATTAAKTAKQKLTQKSAIKEILTVTGFDAALNVGTDYLYQHAMMRTGNQEDYRWGQGTLAAVGAFAMGGIATGSVLMKGSSVKGRLAHEALEASRNPEELWTGVVENMTKMLKESTDNWNAKVARGKKLDELPMSFWTRFMGGDSDLETEGIVHHLLRQGYGYEQRFEGDKVSNWIADWMKAAEPEDIAEFSRLLREDYGIDMKPGKQGLEEFSDQFAANMSRAGETLGYASGFSKGNLPSTRLDRYVQKRFGVNPANASKTTNEMNAFSSLIQKSQGQVIRGIVANLSTTWLNLGGWSQATLFNSATDMALGAGEAAMGLMKKATSPEEAAELIRRGGARWAMQKQKMTNLIDPDTTVDEYLSILASFPKEMQELDFNLAGGMERFANQLDIDLKVASNKMSDLTDQQLEKLVEFLSKSNLVYAQDIFTKSQEFMYQLDKMSRIKFGKSWGELTLESDFAKISGSKQFQEMLGESVYETNRAIFSQTMKDATTLGEVAGFIEDFRKIPGVGVTIPFGRFFNNTVATVSDHTGLSLIAKMSTAFPDPVRSTPQLAARAAVTWTAILSGVSREMEYIEKGYAWSEGEASLAGFGVGPHEEGVVQDYTYNYPGSAVKAAQRIIARWVRDEGVPQAEREGISANVLGQLTRDLNDMETLLFGAVDKMLSGEITREEVLGLMAAVPEAAVSGVTRGFEPVSAGVGLVRGYNFSTMDRKQGNEILNNTLRYLDGVRSLVGLGGVQDTRQTVSGPAKPSESKFAGNVRTVQRHSATEKMMNKVGIQGWRRGLYAGSAEANNRYHEVYHDILEGKAYEIINSEMWNDPDVEFEDKAFAANRALTETAESVKALMSANVAESGDREKALLIKIYSKGASKVNRALSIMEEEYGEEFNPDEMSMEDLQILDGLIDLEKHERDYRTRQFK